MPRTIMLAGAPQADAWQEEDLTVNDLIPAFSRVMNDVADILSSEEETTESDKHGASTTSSRPVWRALPLELVTLHTGWSQQDWNPEPMPFSLPSKLPEEPALSFLTSTDGSSQEELELSQYLEKSFAIHEEAQSSQLAPASETPALRKHCTLNARAASANLNNASFSSTSSASPFNSPTVDCSPTPLRPIAPPILPNLTDLAKLPSEATLASLEPQTVTVDLIIGIISISLPRTVTIRRTGREIELVEVLVGDETRAGFCVTFWLPPRVGNNAKRRVPDLRDAVMRARSGQVVCMRHVALARYKGVVHGQTLAGRGRAASATSLVRVEDVVRLGRGAREGRKSGLLEKVERVRRWTRDFVRPVDLDNLGEAKGRKRKVAEMLVLELPPDDTQ